MHYLKQELSTTSFSQDEKPVLTIKSGEKVQFQTYDCFSNQIQSESDLVTGIDFSKANPATGPVYVEDALPGDILKVEIGDIGVRDWGVISVVPGMGVLTERAEMKTKIVTVNDNSMVMFNDDIQFPMNPMIGVIGVAPSGDGIPTGMPGDHGGNIDSKIITTGSTVYLPVSVEGALFGLGDVHSAMGDGEICGTGAEVASDVKVTLSVLKGQTIPRPMVETEDSWYTIAAHEDTQTAIKLASEAMHDLLVEKWNLSSTDAYLLMSVSGDAEISQSCKPSDLDVVMRFKMPKLDNLPNLLENK